MTSSPIGRRAFALGLAATAGAASLPAFAARRPGLADWTTRLGGIERAAGGRLGAFVLDTGSGRSFGWRQGERFGMCSTFKLSLAAMALRDIDAGRISGKQMLRFGKSDLLPNSPVTGAAVEQGQLSVLALAEAGQKMSDNLAANLLMARLGGPAALTWFWRSLGDDTSRLDRYETELNFVPPGEMRDTTTAGAITRSVERFLVGNVLSPASRALLLRWMAETTTGTRRLRARLPQGWTAGDKTGTGMAPGMASKLNDIAILTPPGRRPLIVTCFYEPAGSPQDIRPQDEAVLAEVGAVAMAFGAYRQAR